MSALGRLRRAAIRAAWPLRAGAARAATLGPRPPRFSGAWPDRDAALAALPAAERAGYHSEAAVEVSFEAMSRIAPWDYPVIFWLSRLAGPTAAILDAGGHMGTKAAAFAPLLPWTLEGGWTVWDTPAVVRAARGAQADGRVPAALRFEHELGEVPRPDLMLCSGLLQYLDRPLAALVGALPGPPAHVILSKVAVRDGPEIVTHERIGPVRVPYRIRDRAAFEAEIAALGYEILDAWEAPELSHVVPTHPHLGASVSRGYALRRTDAAISPF